MIDYQNWRKLIYDNELDCWKTKIEIYNNHFIEVTIETEDKQNILIKHLNNQIISKIMEILKEETKIRFCAANKLLGLYNKTWNDGEDIDCHTFTQKLKLEEIFFDADENHFQFCYDDGNLFLGHNIIVNIDADGLFQDAGIVG